jgi:16S rRNA (cytosine1402-N4)-methyltransferase
VSTAHITVLLKEAVEFLALKKDEVVVDATLGMAGHSEAILKKAEVKLYSFDADAEAAASGREKLKKFGSRSVVINANFADLTSELAKQGVTEVNKFLFDLGWNKEQLASGRGFSFLRDEPLEMSYGTKPRSGFTAAEILNTWDEKVIADVLFGYGEERYARRIAKAVVERREVKPFETTVEFVEVIKDAVPANYRHGRIHPATKSFQALRVAVNDELGVIETALGEAWSLLAPQGRIVVITFHSIEDRLVKKRFAHWAKEAGHLITKKPVTPTKEEITQNPSARSAKMRIIEKN